MEIFGVLAAYESRNRYRESAHVSDHDHDRDRDRGGRVSEAPQLNPDSH
jgi:hypothetical protein